MDPLENRQRIILEDACQFDHVHPIDRIVIGRVDGFEYFFRDANDLLNGHVKLIADPFIEIVQDMEVNDNDVSLGALFGLQLAVIGKEEEKVVS